ncbi:hypothetical protein HDU67_001995 [Dinochytrium kinnereticum]|nr:hypothetical protein HDU67_001995 [Dinochytrium kinnereticum]
MPHSNALESKHQQQQSSRTASSHNPSVLLTPTLSEDYCNINSSTDPLLAEINSMLNSASAAPLPASTRTIELPQTPASLSMRSTPTSSVAGMASNNVEGEAAAAEENQDFPEIAYVTDEAGNILSLQEDEWNTFIAKNADIPVPPHIERCMSPNIIGRNLFEFISDEKVQAFSRHIVYMLCSGQQQKFQYYWFCDSPDVERKMYMTVSALTGFGSAKLVLWVSKIISEKVLKLPQNYLNSPALTSSEQGSEDTSLEVPTNTMPFSVNDLILTFTINSKRIMVLCEDMAPETVSTILSVSTIVPKPLLSHGPIPILGLRGKLGEQVQLSTKSGVVNHLWLTPHQYYVVAGLGDNIRIRHGICEVCYNEIGFTFFPPGTFEEGVPVASISLRASQGGNKKRDAVASGGEPVQNGKKKLAKKGIAPVLS